MAARTLEKLAELRTELALYRDKLGDRDSLWGRGSWQSYSHA